ncbi:TRAP transporter large permease [Marispirochaeta aestuarii]|uniref:TRAP transporter large permease n=1 Tax=Marispirochaeta aestuarii TaxID=1963862 RepID=UPI0029C67244|nr:TRAP transporter large permease [Marispirochaeta aestuarii]
MSWYLIIPFFILLIAFILRMPIGMGMLVGSIAYYLVAGISIGSLVNTVCYGLTNAYILIAIPLFIFTANVMNSSEVTDKIFNFARSLIGRRPGATGYVNILASLIFAGMTGSAVADASGLGMLEISQMKKEGYDMPFTCAITASTAVIGPIFPPSIPFVIYAMISGASVGKLFMGGMVPAIILCIVIGIYVYFISKKRNYPIGEKVSLKYFISSTINALPALMTPVVLLLGIYTGVMTPTEAGAVAAAYTLLISFLVYRTLNIRSLGKILLNTIRTSGAIFLVIAGAYGFSYIITAEQISKVVVEAMSGLVSSPMAFLLMINILFLILGALVDVNVSELVFLPIIMPLVHYYNIDIIHFGVMICLNMMIGLLTPPFGMLLFVTAGIGEVSLKEMIRETLPMILVLLVALAIITYIPESVLFMTRFIK